MKVDNLSEIIKSDELYRIEYLIPSDDGLWIGDEDNNKRPFEMFCRGKHMRDTLLNLYADRCKPIWVYRIEYIVKQSAKPSLDINLEQY